MVDICIIHCFLQKAPGAAAASSGGPVPHAAPGCSPSGHPPPADSHAAFCGCRKWRSLFIFGGHWKYSLFVL